MRWALAILFSLNVVLFLWIRFGPGQEEQKRAPEFSDFGEIRLLHETDNEQEQQSLPVSDNLISSPPEQDESRETEVTNATAGEVLDSDVQPLSEMSREEQASAAITDIEYCGSLGPFPSRNMAEGYLGKISREPGIQVRIEARPGKETVGYWVMIPPLPDSKEAENMLKRLQKAGFKDLWLMRKGEHANGISMGLYTEERYARRHGNSIREKGFETQIVPKQKKARRYWLVFSHAHDSFVEKLEGEKLPSGVMLEKKVCS